MVHNNSNAPFGVQELSHNGPVFRTQGHRRGFPLPSKLLVKKERAVKITQQTAPYFLVLL